MPILMLKVAMVALATILALELGLIASQWDDQRRPGGWA
jgi:hypothetical protein